VDGGTNGRESVLETGSLILRPVAYYMANRRARPRPGCWPSSAPLLTLAHRIAAVEGIVFIGRIMAADSLTDWARAGPQALR